VTLFIHYNLPVYPGRRRSSAYETSIGDIRCYSSLFWHSRSEESTPGTKVASNADTNAGTDAEANTNA